MPSALPNSRYLLSNIDVAVTLVAFFISSLLRYRGFGCPSSSSLLLCAGLAPASLIASLSLASFGSGLSRSSLCIDSISSIIIIITLNFPLVDLRASTRPHFLKHNHKHFQWCQRVRPGTKDSGLRLCFPVSICAAPFIRHQFASLSSFLANHQ